MNNTDADFSIAAYTSASHSADGGMSCQSTHASRPAPSSASYSRRTTS